MAHNLFSDFSPDIVRCLTLFSVPAAHASFYVDDFEIDDPGQCSVESWISFASNADLLAVTNPTCVVRLGIPVEIGTQIQRSRAAGVWSNVVGPTAKITLMPMTNHVGIGLSGQVNWDTRTGASAGGSFNIPISFDLGHSVRLNLNSGGLYDEPSKRSFATYGAGFEWGVTQMIALIAEVYGQVGPQVDPTTITQPRFQTGVRFSPSNALDINLIYGRNLNGENANWLTLGFNINFNPH